MGFEIMLDKQKIREKVDFSGHKGKPRQRMESVTASVCEQAFVISSLFFFFLFLLFFFFFLLFFFFLFFGRCLK